MPIIFGTNILTVSYDADTKIVSLTGEAFGINEYAGISNIEVSSDGVTWTAVDSIDSWGDEAATGSFTTALAPGIYDVRLTSSDGEQDTYDDGITVVSAGNNIFFDNFHQLSIEYGVM